LLHFASPASPADCLHFPIQTLKFGALGTHNAPGLAKAKAVRFLLASTSEAYGELGASAARGLLGQREPRGPAGVYDEAKRFAEAMTMAYHRANGLETRIARIFNTIGSRMRLDDGRAVPAFITQALRGQSLTVHGDGSQTRSVGYVSDLVEGVVRLLRSRVIEPVNLCNPEEIPVIDLAKMITRMACSDSGAMFGERPEDDPSVRRPTSHARERCWGGNRRLAWKRR
jgi:dTDP-glucose 4,6-dehydratase